MDFQDILWMQSGRWDTGHGSLPDKAIYTHFFTYINKPEHPNAAEHRQMAESLIRFIEEHIKW